MVFRLSRHSEIWGPIVAHEWARNVIRRTYSGVIVDEYQDCIVEQHQIFLNLNQSVPVYVLGDPMQAIFGWAGTLVSWENIEFEPVCVQTRPWRWKDTNPNLGEYLNIMRERLRPALQGKQVTISVNNYQKSVFVVSPSQSINWKTRYVDGRFIKKLEKYHHVLYISSDPKFQIELCTRTAGKFQNDEPQECRELFNTAKDLDSNDIQKISQALYRFLTICATGIKAKLGSYWKHIEAGDFNFQRIKKFPRFAELVMELKANPTIDNILNILTWVRKNGSFPIYRRELFYELERALRYARDTDSSVMEAVQRIRSVPSLRKTYSFQFLSSRTTLSKGLEFDCVIIDLTQKYPLCVTDYYVALTRATKAVYLITDKNTVIFKK